MSYLQNQSGQKRGALSGFTSEEIGRGLEALSFGGRVPRYSLALAPHQASIPNVPRVPDEAERLFVLLAKASDWGTLWHPNAMPLFLKLTLDKAQDENCPTSASGLRFAINLIMDCFREIRALGMENEFSKFASFHPPGCQFEQKKAYASFCLKKVSTPDFRTCAEAVSQHYTGEAESLFHDIATRHALAGRSLATPISCP